MRVILDSNVLLIILPKSSKYRTIFDRFLNNELTLIISNEVINEYLEVLERFSNYIVATNVSELLLIRPNVEKYDIYYNWGIIVEDYDDNKFVDLAVASNSDFIVTNDKHFNILETIDFPKVNIIKLEDFNKLLENQ